MNTDHVETVSIVPEIKPVDITGMMIQILPYGDLVHVAYALTSMNKQFIHKQLKLEDNVYGLYRAAHMQVQQDAAEHLHSGMIIATYLREGAPVPSDGFYKKGLVMMTGHH